MPGGALEGIRVVELGELVSAPYCARLFADFGADVVKVEPPGGERARRWGPFPGDRPDPERSGLFLSLNTNKRGVTADLDTPGGRDTFHRLVEGADVLIENQPAARVDDLGLDYDALSALNPGLVMISISPYGRTGPYRDWVGHDLNAFHLSAAGHRYCGRPGEAPLQHGTFSADYYGAVTAAAWGLAAVTGRDRVGGGQHVDVSCSEAIAATFVGGQNIGGFAQDGVFDRRTGVGMGLSGATIVPCADGFVWMIVLETGQWRGLVKAMGDPEWAQLEIFDDMLERGRNKDVIYPLIQEWTMQHGKFEIMEVCQAHGAPVTAVFDVAEAAEQPHLRERGYIVEVDDPGRGPMRHLGAPFRLPASPGGPRHPAPRLADPGGAATVADAWGGPRDPAASRSPVAPSPGTGTGTEGGTGGGTGGGRRPLEGIRVANFGWVWAGPVVGQTLAFCGAEVYKVESRARIDMTRTLPPFAEGVRGSDRSLSHHAGWAGNGSVTVNLKTAEGRELAKELIARCDVVVENFAPGVMERLGLGYDELRAVRPDLVMFSMPAAGLTGPLRDIRTYGLSLASLTGLDSVTGYAGGPPVPMENAFTDPYNGIFGAFAILVALHHRDRTGEGQHIDYSQQEAVMQMLGPAFTDLEMNGRVAGTMGNRHPLGMAAPHGVFPSAGDDRWISIAVTDDDEWEALAGLAAADGASWATAPDLATLAGRLADLDALHERIGTWTAGHDHRELAGRLQAVGVAAAPVLSVGDLLDDPQYRARGTFVEVHHPLGFDETIYGAYVKTSRSDVRVEPGPVIGRDNEHVFLEILGLPRDRYDKLVEDQVIH